MQGVKNIPAGKLLILLLFRNTNYETTPRSQNLNTKALRLKETQSFSKLFIQNGKTL